MDYVEKLPFVDIFLYDLYIFGQIYHSCLANIVFAFKSQQKCFK